VETKLQLLDASVALAFSTGEAPPSPSQGPNR